MHKIPFPSLEKRQIPAPIIPLHDPLNSVWSVEFFEPAEVNLLHDCNLQARKDDLDLLVFISEILKQDSKTCSKEIQPNLGYIQRIIGFSLFKVEKTSTQSLCRSYWPLNRLTVVCETKWKSVVCEMKICSLQNENL